MACKEIRGCKLLLCLGLFVIVTSFCHGSKLTRVQISTKSHKMRGNLILSPRGSGDPRNGRLVIGLDSLLGLKLEGRKATKNFLTFDADYQSDMGM